MNKRKKKEMIYSVSTEDIQQVAEENFGRKLTSKEVKKILDPIADRIPWYDAIYEAIKDTLNIEELDEYDKKYS